MGFEVMMLWTMVAMAMFVSVCQSCEPSCKCKVETDMGPMMGCLKKSSSGRDYCAYFSMRYAMPPLNKLRFKSPQRIDSYTNSVYYANESRARCPQRQQFSDLPETTRIVGSEDCLYMTIYTPKVGECNQTSYPILFYVYPSGYLRGSGALENSTGASLLMDHDVILVTLNYRIGALGFLSTGDTVVPGNWALKDLALAASVVYTNAAPFGGDQNKMTALGINNGAFLAQLLVQTPQAGYLFNNIILLSGTLFCPYAVAPVENVTTPSQQLAVECGCPTSCSEALLDCMQKVPVRTIIEKQADVYANPDAKKAILAPWAPVVEPKNSPNAALVSDPTSWRSKNSCPVFFGTTQYDGSRETSYVLDTNNGLLKRFNEDRITTIINLLRLDLYFPRGILRQVAAAFDDYFLKDIPIGRCLEYQLNAMFGAWNFFFPIYRTAHSLPSHAANYLYSFNAPLSVSWNTVYPGGLTERPAHLDIMLPLFTLEAVFPDRKYPPSDLKIIKYMTTYVVNFATYGDPSYTSDVPAWQPIGKAGRATYVNITNAGVTQYPDYDSKDIEFVRQLLSKYQSKHSSLSDNNSRRGFNLIRH